MLEFRRSRSVNLLHLTVVAIAFLFSSCKSGSTGSESQIHSLEAEISSLQKDINTLKDQVQDLTSKNNALEIKIKSVENNVSTLGYKVRP